MRTQFAPPWLILYSVLIVPLAVVGCSDDDDPVPTCPAGQVFSPTEGRCVESEPIDADNDGVAAEDDCNDADAMLGARSADADCDGALTADDCDDADAMLGAQSADADCDGALTADDCNDADAMVGSMVTDMDCDGIATADDCDDGSAQVGPRSADADCDGTLTADDCDDEDENVGAVALDTDCDGTVNAEDECPTDPAFSVSPPPAVVSTFPTPFSTTNADTLNVGGTVTLFCDATLDGLTARVNGTAVTPQTEMIDDRRMAWRLSASLALDAVNTIAVSVTDSLAKVATATVAVEQFRAGGPVPVILGSSQGIALDPNTNIAYVSDEALPGVYAIDLNNGIGRVLSGPNAGTGDAFTADLEGGIAFDAAGNRILVTDDGADSVVAVDLVTGDRTTVSGPGDEGPALSTPYGIAVDPATNTAYLVDTTLDGVVSVDLATGDRTIVSADGTRGTGVDISSPRDIDLDLTNNRALVVGTVVDAVVAVDLSTGDRTILSSTSTGAGAAFSSLRGITIDAANNRALVSEAANGFEGVIAVDLATGDRTELSGQNEGMTIDSGADFDSTRGVVIDAVNNRLVAVDDAITSLVAIEPTTGNRTLIVPSEAPIPAVGMGPALNNPFGIVYNAEQNTLYVADDGLDAIIAVDLATGDRRTVADNTSPGVTLVQPRGLGFDPANNRLLVPDNSSMLDAVVGVDLSTGEGTIISGDDSPDEMSETFGSPRGRVVVEPSGLTGLVADTFRDSVFRFDLATGERTTLAEGGDAELEGVQTVAIDVANNRALATVASTTNDDVLDGLLAIDLSSGERTTLASRSTDMPAVGTGIDMTNPRGLAFDEANGRALIFDADLDALISVDLASLERTVVSSTTAGGGDLLGVAGNDTNAIDIDRENQRVFAISEDSGQVLLIDVASGDQVIISR